jgi:hypothetical protein
MNQKQQSACLNPVSKILKNNNPNDAGLITIASRYGEGKSTLCNSMLYYYLLSGINMTSSHE